MNSKSSLPHLCVAISLCLTALLVIAGAATAPGQVTAAPAAEGPFEAQETLLGPWNWFQLGTLPTISRDGQHVAYADRGHCGKGTLMCVVLDGVPVPAGPKRYIGGPVALSADGKRLAFITLDAGHMWAVVDGVVGPQFDEIPGGNSILFSRDGDHYAYIAGKGKMAAVVADGKEGAPYEGVFQLGFDPQDRVVYSVKRGKKLSFVVGETEFGQDWDISARPSFSPDGKHMAFIGCKANGKTCTVVRDGKPGPTFDEIYLNLAFFSPDGSRFWYGAKSGGRWTVVLDGEPGPYYDEISNSSCHTSVNGGSVLLGLLLPIPMTGGLSLLETKCSNLTFTFFSPDSRHTWYPAKKGASWVSVEDGRESAEFRNVWLNAFSFDSSHLVYTRVPKNRAVTELIEDGNKVTEVPGIAFPHFSPDDKHLAYATYSITSKEPKWAMVLDGTAGREYRKVDYPVFSPDSQHLAHLAQTGGVPAGHTPNAIDPGGKWVVVLDNDPGREFSFILPGTLRFQADGALSFLAVQKGAHSIFNDDGSLYRVRYIPKAKSHGGVGERPPVHSLAAAPPPAPVHVEDGNTPKEGEEFPVKDKKDIKFLQLAEGAKLSNTRLPSGKLVPAAPEGMIWRVRKGRVVLEKGN